jgi:class 3 adenylate cyclase
LLAKLEDAPDMGDAIMAFWNAPLDIPDHPVRACRAVLKMRRRLQFVLCSVRGGREAGGWDRA